MDVDRPVPLSVGTSTSTDDEPHADAGEMDVDRPVPLSVGTSTSTDDEPHADAGEPALEGDEDQFIMNESKPEVSLVISDDWIGVPSVVFDLS
ncbi:hypothetical protein DFH08DRAFT_948056 [Mycena albidolilacea]|uniref:Uncharacterized protein n=1 Tax=Mycena albidolilacea TaxID=1033008 RepID=A0AAD7AWA9_9AGAR|nr:hypothetical protein DFH08DRAFT_948056 [Mycena albidolilacea]